MKVLLIFFATLFSQPFYAQDKKTLSVNSQAPRLVVGIVIDQMRQEYLYRYATKFGEGGFKKIIREGFSLTNMHYNYVPTYTGPGHASIYTGATPASHGIVGNYWYDRASNKIMYCTQDDKEKAVGSDLKQGNVSPRNLISSTITDELKMATLSRAKVISISLKDRGAVLPGGHHPDGAFWYDGTTGSFITSSYYAKKLPDWVNIFNRRELPNQYLEKIWNPLFSKEKYQESASDERPYEQLKKNKPSTFPYPLNMMRKEYEQFELLPYTPFGNTLLTQLALASIEGEQMGQDEWTDFLAISYSSPDIVGHAAGPYSMEIEDLYLRLDKELEHLITHLDRNVGKDHYLLFLTADHGVADAEEYAKEYRIIADKKQPSDLKKELLRHLKKQGYADEKIISRIINNQVYVDEQRITQGKKHVGRNQRNELTKQLAAYLSGLMGMADAYTKEELRASCLDESGMRGLVKRGMHTHRSGDVVYVREPGHMASNDAVLTTHGTGYTYDTHIPMLWYGAGIRKGTTAKYYPITAIAPTLAMLLKIKFPSTADIHHPIVELINE